MSRTPTLQMGLILPSRKSCTIRWQCQGIKMAFIISGKGVFPLNPPFVKKKKTLHGIDFPESKVIILHYSDSIIPCRISAKCGPSVIKPKIIIIRMFITDSQFRPSPTAVQKHGRAALIGSKTADGCGSRCAAPDLARGNDLNDPSGSIALKFRGNRSFVNLDAFHIGKRYF